VKSFAPPVSKDETISGMSSLITILQLLPAVRRAYHRAKRHRILAFPTVLSGNNCATAASAQQEAHRLQLPRPDSVLGRNEQIIEAKNKPLCVSTTKPLRSSNPQISSGVSPHTSPLSCRDLFDPRPKDE